MSAYDPARGSDNGPISAPISAPALSEAMARHLAAGSAWDQHSWRAVERSRGFAWAIAIAASGLAMLALLALVLVLPLKEFAPYVVAIDRASGALEIVRPLKPGALSQDEAVITHEIVRYVTARETYDPADIHPRFDLVRRLSSASALKDYETLWTPDAPQNPALRFGWKTRIQTRVQAVSFLRKDVAAVRYVLEKTDRATGAVSAAQWVAIVGFAFSDAPMREAERWDNPLGFTVTSFRADPETLAAPAPALAGAALSGAALSGAALSSPALSGPALPATAAAPARAAAAAPPSSGDLP